jgi:diaminopimelate epimerase
MGPAKVEDVTDGPASRSAEVIVANPHLVLVAEPGLDLEALGRQYPDHNVEIITVIDRGHLDMRVWERGAGLT